MRVLKWISIGLGSLIALVVIGVLVIVWLVDPNRFKPRIERAVRDATGREFALEGDIELGFFPWLALRTGAGRFGNAPGFPAEPMITWRGAQLGAKLFPLLHGELVADRVKLTGVDLRLVRHADGRANWQGIGAQPDGAPATSATPTTPFRIDGVEVDDSRISFVDEAAQRRIEITGFHFETDEIARGEPFTDTQVSGTLHAAGFAPAGVPFALDLPRVALPADFSRVDVEKFAVRFGVLQVEGAVRGTLGDAAALAGHLESDEFAPRELLAAVGIDAPKTTDPAALSVISLRGDWRFDAGAIAVDPFALRVDDSRFTGSFQRGAGDSPRAQLALEGDSLDIARYVPPTDPASEPFKLPTAMLKALALEATIRLGEATYEDTRMKGVTLRLILDEQGLRQPPAGQP